MGSEHAQAELVDPRLKHGTKLPLDEGALVGGAVVLAVKPHSEAPESRLTHHLGGAGRSGVAGRGGGGLEAGGHHHHPGPSGGGRGEGGA